MPNIYEVSTNQLHSLLMRLDLSEWGGRADKIKRLEDYLRQMGKDPWEFDLANVMGMPSHNNSDILRTSNK